MEKQLQYPQTTSLVSLPWSPPFSLFCFLAWLCNCIIRWHPGIISETKRNQESWHFLIYVQTKKSVLLPQKTQNVLGAVHLHNKRQFLLLKEHSMQLGKPRKTGWKLLPLLFQLRNWDVQELKHATGMLHNPWKHRAPSLRSRDSHWL